MLVLFGLVLAASDVAATTDTTPVPTPLGGSLSDLITSDDYPSKSLARNEEGSVGIVIKVDATGAVRDCVVEKTSGFELLDAQTCRVISKRAKFAPARDAAGNAVASEMRSRIVWSIASNGVPTDAWSDRQVLDFGTDGKLASCHVESDGAVAPAAGASLPDCSASLLADVAGGLGDMLGARAKVVLETRFLPVEAPIPQTPQGYLVAGQQLLDLDIDAHGYVKSCVITAQKGIQVSNGGCTQVLQDTFRSHVGADGKRTPMRARIQISVFAHLDKPVPGRAAAAAHQ